MTKPRHSPPRIEDKDLLELLGKARDGVIKFSGMHGPRSGYRAMASTVIKNIDELAQILTGDPTYFAIKAHSAPPPPHYRPKE